MCGCAPLPRRTASGTMVVGWCSFLWGRVSGRQWDPVSQCGAARVSKRMCTRVKPDATRTRVKPPSHGASDITQLRLRQAHGVCVLRVWSSSPSFAWGLPPTGAVRPTPGQIWKPSLVPNISFNFKDCYVPKCVHWTLCSPWGQKMGKTKRFEKKRSEALAGHLVQLKNHPEPIRK